jgi:hypothetical protein
MPWSEDDIFRDESIVEPRVLVSEHRFNLEHIDSSVTVRIYKHLRGNQESRFSFETSHYIHTPEQIGPYIPSTPWYDDQSYALHRAVDSIVTYYNAAVKVGHTPSSEWLVPNEFFSA